MKKKITLFLSLKDTSVTTKLLVIAFILLSPSLHAENIKWQFNASIEINGKEKNFRQEIESKEHSIIDLSPDVICFMNKEQTDAGGTGKERSLSCHVSYEGNITTVLTRTDCSKDIYRINSNVAYLFIRENEKDFKNILMSNYKKLATGKKTEQESPQKAQFKFVISCLYGE